MFIGIRVINLDKRMLIIFIVSIVTKVTVNVPHFMVITVQPEQLTDNLICWCLI